VAVGVILAGSGAAVLNMTVMGVALPSIATELGGPGALASRAGDRGGGLDAGGMAVVLDLSCD
jgi:hypothetical protein